LALPRIVDEKRAAQSRYNVPDNISVNVIAFILVPFMHVQDVLALGAVSRSWRLHLCSEIVWRKIYNRDLLPLSFTEEQVQSFVGVFDRQAGRVDFPDCKTHRANLLDELIRVLPKPFLQCDAKLAIRRIFEQLPRCDVGDAWSDLGYEIAVARSWQHELSTLPPLPLVQGAAHVGVVEPESITYDRISSWPLGIASCSPESLHTEAMICAEADDYLSKSVSSSWRANQSQAGSSKRVKCFEDSKREHKSSVELIGDRYSMKGSRGALYSDPLCVLRGPIAPSKAEFIVEYRARRGQRTITADLLRGASLASLSYGYMVVWLFCLGPLVMSLVLVLLAMTLNAEDGMRGAFDFNRDQVLFYLVLPYGSFAALCLPICVASLIWYAYNCYRPVKLAQHMTLRLRLCFAWLGDPSSATACVSIPLVCIALIALAYWIFQVYFWPTSATHSTSIGLLAYMAMCNVAFICRVHLFLYSSQTAVDLVLSGHSCCSAAWYLVYVCTGICSCLVPYVYICGTRLPWSAQLAPFLLVHLLLMREIWSGLWPPPRFGAGHRPTLGKNGVLFRVGLSFVFFARIAIQLDLPRDDRINWLVVVAPLVLLLLSVVPFGLAFARAGTNEYLARVRLTNVRSTWSNAGLSLTLRHKLGVWGGYIFEHPTYECGCIKKGLQTQPL